MSEKKLTKAQINKSWFWYFMTCMSAVCAERQNGIAYGAGMATIADTLYGDNPEEKKAYLKRHISYYITDHCFGSSIYGLVLSMEEKKASGNDEITEEMIVGIKSSLMGPLAGFGDPLWQSCYRALLVAYTQPLAMQGNAAAALACWFGYAIPRWIVGYIFLWQGYNMGQKSIMNLLQNNKIKNIVSGCGVLGMFIMGAMTCSYVKVQTVLEWTVNEKTVLLQDILNSSVPGLLPLGLTLLIYWLFAKKQKSPTIIMVGILVVALIGAAVGFF